MNTLSYSFMDTPLGLMRATASQKGLCELNFIDLYPTTMPLSIEDPEHPILMETRHWLSHYFSKQALPFPSLDLQGSSFALDAWAALCQIPFGKIRSYQELALTLGKPKAFRAVGNAMGRNPIAILVPCHRVIGSKGQLGGYTSGLKRKEWLLDHEGHPPFK